MNSNADAEIYVTRLRGSFTAIPNHVFNDEKISAKALGLLAYLLACSERHQVELSDIRTRFKFGKDLTYRLIRELADAGYLERSELRDEDGRFAGVEYSISSDRRT